MRHRIFIAINLPEDIKKKLSDYQLKWPELPCRWTKKENLHITLAFLSYLTDEEMVEVCKITKEVAEKYDQFFINLKRIIYGSTDKRPPRMIWAEGERSEELGRLRNDLGEMLKIKEERSYAPHLTLGRLKQWEFQRIEPEERPEVSEEINLNFEVNSVEVMESQLKRGGPKYTVLETCPLKT